VNSSRTSDSTDSLRLEYPGETDLVTWNAHRDAGYTTYTVGSPPTWDAYFLDRGAAEMAAGEFGGSYCRWDGKTGHMVTVPEEPRSDAELYLDLEAARYG
jgi:hypothetical protein